MSNIHLIVSVTWRVVEYERRVVRGDEAFKLRDAVKEIVFQQPASSFVSYANRRNGARFAKRSEQFSSGFRSADLSQASEVFLS